jgi:hypothetical protein
MGQGASGEAFLTPKRKSDPVVFFDDALQQKSFQLAKRIVKIYHSIRMEKGNSLVLEKMINLGNGLADDIAKATADLSTESCLKRLDAAYQNVKRLHYCVNQLFDSRYIPRQVHAGLVDMLDEVGGLLFGTIKRCKK